MGGGVGGLQVGGREEVEEVEEEARTCKGRLNVRPLPPPPPPPLCGLSLFKTQIILPNIHLLSNFSVFDTCLSVWTFPFPS